MTEAEALLALQPPLKFGDPVQIKAHQFLERVNECQEAFENCQDEHLDVCAATDCSCIGSFTDDVIMALKVRRKENIDCPDCGGDGYIECSNCCGSGEI